MNIIKGIVLSIGLSLIIAVSTGWLYSNDVYYSLHYNQTKNEITKESYDKEDSEDRQLKTVFNFNVGLSTGFISIGILLSLMGMKKDKTEVYANPFENFIKIYSSNKIMQKVFIGVMYLIAVICFAFFILVLIALLGDEKINNEIIYVLISSLLISSVAWYMATKSRKKLKYLA